MTNSDTKEVGTKEGPTRIVIPGLLRAARETYRNEIRKALSEGGFEDLPRNGPFVLGAMVNAAVPLSEVIPQLGVSKQAASQLIDVLVLRGYMERLPEPTDRRRVTLAPTERGRAAAAATRAGIEAVDRLLEDMHTPDELLTFRACLSSLADLRRPHDKDDRRPGRDSVSRTRLIKFNPIFAVRDLGRALDHYRNLGFEVKAYAKGDEYGFAERDGVGLHLSTEDEFDPARDASEAYLYVEDADGLAAEWGSSGVGGKTIPVSQTEYGMREGAHIDPDNNLIRFGSYVTP